MMTLKFSFLKFNAIFFTVAFLSAFQLDAQELCPEFVWGRSNENHVQTGTSDANSIITDQEGNVYVCGYYSGILEFGEFVLTQGPEGTGVFAAKFNNEGECLWAISINGDDAEVNSTSLGLDAAGNIYISGSFTGSVNFGSETISSPDYDDSDIFISKLNPEGEWIWTKRVGGDGNNWVLQCAVDNDGTVYISSFYYESCYFGSIFLPANPETGIFIAKLNTSGEWEWVTKETTFLRIEDYRMQLQGQEIILSGTFHDSLDFGNSTLTSAGGLDLFLSRLNLDGEWISAVQLGGANNDYAQAIIDEDNNMYVFGGYDIETTIDGEIFTSTGNNPFFVKFNSQGDLIWRNEVQGAYPNSQGISNAVLGTDNSLYIMGGISGMGIFDQDTLYATSGGDIFVAKINKEGEWCGVVQTAHASEFGFWPCMAVHDSASIYIAGGFKGLLDFNNSVVSGDRLECFLAKCSLQRTEPYAKIVQSGDTLLAVNTQGPYKWIHCNGNSILGADQQFYIVTAPGDYAVVVNECDKNHISNCISITDETEDQGPVSLYPNPSNGFITVSGGSMSLRNMVIEDVKGKIVLVIPDNQNHSEIDVRGLQSGMYLLNFELESKRVTKRFVLE